MNKIPQWREIMELQGAMIDPMPYTDTDENGNPRP